ncbi:MAG: tRNA (cytidine(34)-2'-O)-methyltransferase, partial [Candidatus Sulfobium sp.]
MLHVVLYRPQIPPNTGNIARQCVGMAAGLHIVKPVGFDLSRQAARRAGLDYWGDVDLTVHESGGEFMKWLGARQPWVITSRGRIRYDRTEYRDEDLLLFGSETLGLPQDWFDRWPERTVYVPMPGKVRNYNLANTVSVVLAQASLKAG